ncbi:AcrR family transcriptional regulator [Burkholderia territorii]|uniref:TetR/AcrR family transcriptional regulator n=1 Tax=Burkholderia territorii TaxID=1503055 RepID=UPI00075E0E28|nr:TetR/AcrR family transcriptional regulator [Burkholderia territorii]KUZ40901.1 AcrR family transcriptional regulator [Burkholderia territorii]KUZ51273.1 AcrR family transcriptional regulator [Burkholderia territorii]KVG60514.1 AcrR family transcriptional regulator [Burkholderia territorii]KVK99150.1 AcrR family transcriptional regulator [Burkholderia territorii]KVL29563.1 AcrR family transcriptional regulator [Burkholderia territorii]
MNKPTPSTSSSRGPSDHEVRAQIVDAATEYFSRYGYEKTTVSDLAKEIGFSKAYIYKFFDSKQAIGQVICANRLAAIVAAVSENVDGAHGATEKFRRMFKTLLASGSQLFFQDRKLYDIAAEAAASPWPSVKGYEDQIRQLIADILRLGRETGEFERKTPPDEAVNAIFLVMKPYFNPLMLQYNLDGAEEATTQLANLVLRSLAP